MRFDFDRLISVVLDSIAPDLLKYDMIFLIGEAGAGKTTIMNILRGKGFNEKYNATDIGEVSRPFASFDSGLKIIKVIDTSGSNLESLPRWKEKDYTIRCFIFDTTQFYKGKKIDKKIRLGIRNTIKEVEYINYGYSDKKIIRFFQKLSKSKEYEEVVKCLAIGTRGDEVDSEDREKIRKEVIKMGIKCKIFELKNNPKKELINFIFKGE